MIRLVQFLTTSGDRATALVDGDGVALRLRDVSTVRELTLTAVRSQRSLENCVRSQITQESVDLDAVESEGRLLPPLDHADPARCWITGTGLTHLGGAEARHKMHEKLQAGGESLTDSLRMFRWGLERGKPAQGVGVQPEWFFKGNGHSLVAPGRPLAMPPFALDGGEEPEIAGLYVIADDGTPCRVGYALGNEFSDHALERQNYLYLAHSKIRPCAIGPELLLGKLPEDIRGTSRIERGGQTVWEKPFLTGEANMSHWLANLEHHHFKYPLFRQPGDVHIHFFGTSTLSSQDGFVAEPGDTFVIEAPYFGRPLRNSLARAESTPVVVRSL